MIRRREGIDRLRARLAARRREHEDELSRFARLKARQPELQVRIAECARRAARLNVEVNQLEAQLRAAEQAGGDEAIERKGEAR
jgi:chromosome segregation ATPase